MVKFALISDTHTRENIECIFNFLKNQKIDFIVINGDILGENEIREGYGYNFNKTLFYAGLNKESILQKIYPKSEELKKFISLYEQGKNDENFEVDFSAIIKDYVETRYNYLIEILRKFSEIAKIFFNVGNYESPLHYNVLKEFSFLTGINEEYIRKVALLSNYRDIFKEFKEKLKNEKKVIYIGGTTSLYGDILIAGIPGLNPSTIPSDSMSNFQEKITEDLMNTLRRQMSYATKLILLNQTQGKLRKDPFSFRPASFAVRNFIESIRGKMRQKIYIQSYHHWVTTHFYYATEFHFILNNAGVNNCLFNIVDIGNKVNVYDVDPKLNKIRELKLYNYNLVDYSKPEERLALNYSDWQDVIKERNIEGCYYM